MKWNIFKREYFENNQQTFDLELPHSFIQEPSQKQKRYWTHEECEKFEKIIKYMNYTSVRGMNYELISSYVKTRTPIQVRSHSQKYFLKHKENTVSLSIDDKKEIEQLLSNNHLSTKLHHSLLFH